MSKPMGADRCGSLFLPAIVEQSNPVLPTRILKSFTLPFFGVMALIGLGLVAVPAQAHYCPFCSAIGVTFAQQLESKDVVVVARLLDIPPVNEDLDADYPLAQFEVVHVIRGNQLVAPKMKFRTQIVGRYPVGQKFLIMGVDPPNIDWSTPMKASEKVFQYLEAIQKLPPKGRDRLLFFQNYFENEERVLALDAYDEFTAAPYADLVAIKDKMHHDQLVQWINDPKIPTNRRRLYLTMLGVCGTEKDIPMLEALIKSDDPKKQGALDALVAAYLVLKGDAGVDLIEERFLANLDSNPVDAGNVVAALRFHGTETNIISKKRIVKAMRHLLDRPEMADMIIPDLARWEDWSVMEKLVQMFKDADEDTNWLRVPVINYLRACPDPKAAAYIKELEKIDPDAVKRAAFLMGGFDDDEEEEEGDQPAESTESSSGSESSSGAAKETPDKTESAPQASVNRPQPEANIAKSAPQPSSALATPSRPSQAYVTLKVPMVDSASDDQTASSAPAVAPPTPSPSVSTAKRVVSLPSAKPTQAPKGEHPKGLERDNGPIEAQGTHALAADARDDDGPEQTTTTLSPRSVNPTTPSLVSTLGDDAATRTGATTPTPPVVAVAPTPNLTWAILLIPAAVSVLIFLLLWSVVNGWFERLIF